ncbi:MAG TPA: phosphotransferase [Actinomycetota bacterium]|jgi:spectinomycin phosphotransferase|nr:phosphotransferase [Actinomycetota bacterium]
MHAEPVDFDRAALAAVLRRDWSMGVRELAYVPVGFGTHHYIASDDENRWFVNVDDLTSKSWIAPEANAAFDGLSRSLRTAVALRSCGLSFVHAPHEGLSGVLGRLDDRYAVSVYTFIDGRSEPHGPYASPEDRHRVLEALGRMHASTSCVSSDSQRRDSFDVPLRGAFFQTLGELGEPWMAGPYSERARSLLSKHRAAARTMFDRYDELKNRVSARAAPFVVTHGEPHAGNVMWTSDGAMHVIDWDTAATAPRERDLWMLEPLTDDDIAVYAASSGTAEVDPDALAMYRLWWALSEITGYTQTLRAPHADDQNIRTSWRGLREYLP